MAALEASSLLGQVFLDISSGGQTPMYNQFDQVSLKSGVVTAGCAAHRLCCPGSGETSAVIRSTFQRRELRPRGYGWFSRGPRANVWKASAYPRWKALGPVFLSFSFPHLFQVPQTEGPSGVHRLTPLLCTARRKLRCREGPVGQQVGRQNPQRFA